MWYVCIVNGVLMVCVWRYVVLLAPRYILYVLSLAQVHVFLTQSQSHFLEILIVKGEFLTSDQLRPCTAGFVAYN